MEKDAKKSKRTEMVAPNGGSIFIELGKTKANESLENTEYDYWHDLLESNIKLVNKAFRNHTFNYENGAGTFFFENPENEGRTLWATPFWEGEDDLSLALQDEETDEYKTWVAPLNTTFEEKKDLKAYIKIMLKETAKYL